MGMQQFGSVDFIKITMGESVAISNHLMQLNFTRDKMKVLQIMMEKLLSFYSIIMESSQVQEEYLIEQQKSVKVEFEEDA